MLAVDDHFAQRIDEALRKCREQMRRQVTSTARTGVAGELRAVPASAHDAAGRAVAVVHDDDFSLRVELEMKRLKGGASRSSVAAPPRSAMTPGPGSCTSRMPASSAAPTDDLQTALAETPADADSSRVVSRSALSEDKALDALVRAWPTLPAPIRSAVTGMVRAHIPQR